MPEELNSGLKWLDDLWRHHMATTTPEERRAMLDEAQKNADPEMDRIFGGPPEDFEDAPEEE